MKLFNLLQSKIELFRLEQRYTRRRERRSTFVSDALYVNGEYVYNVDSPSSISKGSSLSQHSGGSSSNTSSTATSPTLSTHPTISTHTTSSTSTTTITTTPYAIKSIPSTTFHHSNSLSDKSHNNAIHSSSNSNLRKARGEARRKRGRGNSLIEEVNAELERAEREEEMEVEDMVGRIEVVDEGERRREVVDVGRERKLRNRLSRISVRELKWDTGK